jgi:hypothetical protein
MLVDTLFPYPDLVNYLNIKPASSFKGYFQIRIQKNIKLLIPSGGQDKKGIYIYAPKKLILTLEKELPGSRKILNLSNEKEPLLFLGENSSLFKINVQKIARLLSTLKK